MPDLAEKNAAVFILLMRARKAWDKGERAADDGNADEYNRLKAKAVELTKDAEAIDPNRECAAWRDHPRGTN